MEPSVSAAVPVSADFLEQVVSAAMKLIVPASDAALSAITGAKVQAALSAVQQRVTSSGEVLMQDARLCSVRQLTDFSGQALNVTTFPPTGK